MREKLGEFCYGEGAVTMEAVVGTALKERGWRLGLAESCTGGLVSHRITAIPGQLRVFPRRRRGLRELGEDEPASA